MKTRKITEEELRNAELPFPMIFWGRKRIIVALNGDYVAYERYDAYGGFVDFNSSLLDFVLNNYEIEVKEPERFYKYVNVNGLESKYFYSDDQKRRWDGKNIIDEPIYDLKWKKTSNYIEV